MSKKTTKIIFESKNDYILGVKGNQKKLLKQIERNIEKSEPVDVDKQVEKNRGRIETRIASVYNNISEINNEWIGLKSIIKIEREAIIKGDKRFEIAYFITSLSSEKSAKFFNDGVRSHWAIENSLHYTKDTTFREDASKIKTGDAPQNISLIRNICINIFRKKGYTNIAQAIRLNSNDIDKIWNLITA